MIDHLLKYGASGCIDEMRAHKHYLNYYTKECPDQSENEIYARSKQLNRNFSKMKGNAFDGTFK